VAGDPVPTAKDLVEHCVAELPDFAVPSFVRIVSKLPKTPTMKVEKYRLRAEGVTPDTVNVVRGRTSPVSR
jgi:crotonobetaine/carnitine-CoA ligase